MQGSSSSGGNLNTNRWNSRAAVGTQTAGLVFGGSISTGDLRWLKQKNIMVLLGAEVADMPTVTDTGFGASGIQTAGFASGGFTPTDTTGNQADFRRL